MLGFSDIGKVVRWRPELVYEELEDADNTGGLEVYDISNNQITNAAFMGTVGMNCSTRLGL